MGSGHQNREKDIQIRQRRSGDDEEIRKPSKRCSLHQQVRGLVLVGLLFVLKKEKFRFSFVLPKVEQIWIVMDFLEGGSLMDYVSPEQVWPEEQIAFVLRDSFKALAYLHSKDRIHRDIKSGNILITGNGEIKVFF